MKAGEGCVRRRSEGGRAGGVVGSLSDSQKTVPHSVGPSLSSAARKTTLEFLTASARWSQDEFIGAMHNAKGRDYHMAAAPGPRQRQPIGDSEGGPPERRRSSLWPAERCRSTPGRRGGVRGASREGVGGSQPRFTSLQAALPSGRVQARRGLKATRTHPREHALAFRFSKKAQTQNDLFLPEPWQHFFLVMGVAVPTR